MIAIPAIDLRDGACVQLVGGSYSQEKVRLSDPLAQAERWRSHGFGRLHVVDLDAATGRGDNAALVAELVRDSRLIVSAGGGVRSEERIAALLDLGAAAVVVGTRAVSDSTWLSKMATRYPGKLVVAADSRASKIAIAGWSAATEIEVTDYLNTIRELPVAGVLVTAIEREGRLAGPNLTLIEDAVAASTAPIIASGGIASRDDLVALQAAGAWAAVIGMALYTGTLNPTATAEEFAA